MKGENRSVLNENSLTEALSETGYRRVQPLVYKASWSDSDVEHLLFFSIHGTPKEYLVAQFGMRNPKAETFSIDCIKNYGGPVYRVLNANRSFSCSVQFSFGRLAGWGVPSWLYIPSFPEEKLLNLLKNDINIFLAPIISNVISLDDLFRKLLEDCEACPWFMTNGAIRAAHIIGVATQIGKNSEEVRALLDSRRLWIAQALRDNIEFDTYIGKVARDARNLLS